MSDDKWFSEDELAQSQESNTLDATFEELSESDERDRVQHDIDLLYDVPVKLKVVFGKITMTVKEFLEINEGDVLELEQYTGELVDLKAGNQLLAKGEIVVIDGYFGIRIKEIHMPVEEIKNIPTENE